MKSIGVLTSGGDTPGMNAVLRAVVLRAAKEGIETIGFLDGWKGLLENNFEKLDPELVSGILTEGGTILGSSRVNPYKQENGPEISRKNVQELDLQGLIAIGGEDTLGVANKLSELGVPVVGVPKTIDNDLMATDVTFGFNTAVSIATEAIDRLHTTARSHHRTLVVEIMGRHSGWLALEAGIAGGAHLIVIPEVDVTLDYICKKVMERYERREKYAIIAIAEGAQVQGIFESSNDVEADEFGHTRLAEMGLARSLAKVIESKTGVETRPVVLGHVQRGGSPTAFDRVLATRFGVKAVELILNGQFGMMVSLNGTEIDVVSLKEAVAKIRTVPKELYNLATLFFQ